MAPEGSGPPRIIGHMSLNPSERRFAVVTTCHAAGYETYGRTMIETFLAHWPAEVALLLYHEGFEPPTAPGRIEAHDLMASCPELVDFKRRHADNPRANGQRPRWRRVRLGPLAMTLPLPRRRPSYRWDAVRFAHKCYALFDAARRTDADVLIWIDADTRFFADVSLAELAVLAPVHERRVLPAPAELHRDRLRRLQPSPSGDAAAARRVRGDVHRTTCCSPSASTPTVGCSTSSAPAPRRAARTSTTSARASAGKAQHVLINSRLGAFMDHMKGLTERTRARAVPMDLDRRAQRALLAEAGVKRGHAQHGLHPHQSEAGRRRAGGAPLR